MKSDKVLQLFCFLMVFFPYMALAQGQPPPPESAVPPVSKDNPVKVSGVVTSGDAALAGAKVWIDAGQVLITDGQGQFSASVFTGVFTVTVRSADNEFIGEKQVIVEKDQKEIKLDFQFNPAKISGEVTENGAIVEGAKVFAGKNGLLPAAAQPGRYETRVQEGELRIFATTPAGEFIGEEALNVSKGEDKIINFDFKPASVEVSVVKDGKPIAGVKVFIGRNAPGVTDKTGRCVQKVCPGTVTIYARDAGHRLIGEKSVTAVSGQTIPVNM